MGGQFWEFTFCIFCQWTRVWANSRRQWRTRKPGRLQPRGSQRVRHSWATERQQSIGLGKIFPKFNCCSYIGWWYFPVNYFCLVEDFSSIKLKTNFPPLFLLTKMLTKCRYLGSSWFIVTHLHFDFCEDIMPPSFITNALCEFYHLVKPYFSRGSTWENVLNGVFEEQSQK